MNKVLLEIRITLLRRSVQVFADRFNSRECIIKINHQEEETLKTDWQGKMPRPVEGLGEPNMNVNARSLHIHSHHSEGHL